MSLLPCVKDVDASSLAACKPSFFEEEAEEAEKTEETDEEEEKE